MRLGRRRILRHGQLLRRHEAGELFGGCVLCRRGPGEQSAEDEGSDDGKTTKSTAAPAMAIRFLRTPQIPGGEGPDTAPVPPPLPLYRISKQISSREYSRNFA